MYLTQYKLKSNCQIIYHIHYVFTFYPKKQDFKVQLLITLNTNISIYLISPKGDFNHPLSLSNLIIH